MTGEDASERGELIMRSVTATERPRRSPRTAQPGGSTGGELGPTGGGSPCGRLPCRASYHVA
jgi:hypothetical protein